MRLTILNLALASAFLSCQQNSNSASDQSQLLIDSLTFELDDIHKRGFINGYGVAILNENGTLYENGFGSSDEKNNKEYSAHSIQNIASVSKPLLGVALLKAQELGFLQLDDAVNDYLPFEVLNPHYPEGIITIRHLATHTATIIDTDSYGQKSYILKNDEDSTLARSIASAAEFNSQSSAMDMKDLLRNFLDVEGEWYNEDAFLGMKPGERYEYSNIGATLAAYVLELATKQDYRAFSKQYILDPLSMSSSGWSFGAVDMKMHSKLYADSTTEIPFYYLITYPDGGLITSIHDMGKYLAELIKGYHGQGKLLTQESYQEFFKEQLTAEHFEERDGDRPYDDEYNAGIFIGFTPTGYIGHMGGDPGVSTFMFFNPETKLGRLLFVNRDLDKNGAKQFYDIWDTLEEYQSKLNKKVGNKY